MQVDPAAVVPVASIRVEWLLMELSTPEAVVAAKREIAVDPSFRQVVPVDRAS